MMYCPRLEACLPSETWLHAQPFINLNSSSRGVSGSSIRRIVLTKRPNYPRKHGVVKLRPYRKANASDRSTPLTSNSTPTHKTSKGRARKAFASGNM
eukprot:6464793-Amphidinium_carterae.2